MALVRWDGSREIDSLQSEMNRVFDAFFGSGARSAAESRSRRWVPPMDLVEEGEELVLRADLPGVAEEDVSIEIKDGTLQISGERRSEIKDDRDGFVRVERAYGSFARSLTLPEGVEAEGVRADFDRGVLEVRIPKPKERLPHKVAIGGGETAALNGSATEKS
ncbi:Hsp20/alpha crystallin family protein [Thermoleophilia bacterium SCSIO 60948]|nr:Hsp20/alpha crystallin family protein [Thermoleophilia bacterium SCSIO 60948]